MVQKCKKEILIYTLLAFVSLCCLISIIYTIYLPSVFKTARIFLLMAGITLIFVGLILILTRLLLPNENTRKYLLYASFAVIIASLIFALAFAIPYAKSKRASLYLQNKKGLTIENINFHNKYNYYIYAQRVTQEIPVQDRLVINKSHTNKKIKVVRKSPTVKVGKDLVPQNLNTITLLTYERYENENKFIFTDNVLDIQHMPEPKINGIHKLMLPSIFSQHKEKGEIIILVPPNVQVSYI